jgi:H+-transporting ATPase
MEDTYRGRGLTNSDVRSKRAQYGYNEVPEPQVGLVRGTLKRLWGPVPWLLEAAMIFEVLLGKGSQAVFVFLLLLFSAVTGEVQETRAKTAIGYLRRQLQINIRTLRKSWWLTLPSRELVPGDVVHVRLGDLVPADIEIVEGNLNVDESALTGESIDVAKSAGDAVSSASTVTHGEAIARVTATGTASTYGKTAELVRTAEAPGRLQVLLFAIVRYLAYLDVVLALVLVLVAVVHGTAWQELLPFLVILFIATIPISMPSSFTVANSLEARTLARRGVLGERCLSRGVAPTGRAGFG